MSITKIIFDNDGVNIDSEHVSMRVMDSWGVDLVLKYRLDANLPKDFIYATYPGTSTDKIIKALVEKFGLPLDQIVIDYKTNNRQDQLDEICKELADLVTEETNACFKKELKSIPGTTQALEAIHLLFGSENVALATTSPKNRMDISLAYAVDPITGEKARLADLFPEGERRRSGYGHNNKYDEAFSALGWDPAQTIIVEDSLSGVSKAKSGRPLTQVIGTVAAIFYEDKEAQALLLLQAGATVVISSMADLPSAATWLKNGMTTPRPEFVAPAFFQTRGRPFPIATPMRASYP